ncbi:MAG: KpsF/GutQ family sugar-phosphate isomerase [Planctomycetota bacterium]
MAIPSHSRTPAAPLTGASVGNLAISLDSESILSMAERIRSIRDTMLTEAAAISKATDIASTAAAEAAIRIAECRGCVVVTGVGKAGLIGQKLVATLASTGSPAHFLHPSEAVHGDLGRVRSDDLVVALSNSGRSDEIVRVAPLLQRQSAGLIALTRDADNTLARLSDLVVPIGHHAEACPNGLAPTTSTAVMLAVGDAIAMLAAQIRGFNRDDFGRFHPGGALGRRLASVDEVMRPLHRCRLAQDRVSVRQAIQCDRMSRRVGAVMLVDDSNRLTGIFTDSDLARLLQARREADLDSPIIDSMTRHPMNIASGQPLSTAIQILSQRKFSELPVVDGNGCPIGMLDVTDLISSGDIRESVASASPATPMAETESDEHPSVLPFHPNS